MLLGYTRISKGDDQTNRLQVQALKSAGVEKIFEESASGGRWDRPQLHKLLEQLRPQDVVVVWKLDRLSRSLKDLLLLMEKIDAAQAGFRSLTEAIDTTTPAGRMMMNMVGTFAKFERAIIRERTNAGLVAARAEGRIGGRRGDGIDAKTSLENSGSRLKSQLDWSSVISTGYGSTLEPETPQLSALD